MNSVSVKYLWHGAQVYNSIKAGQCKNLERACIFLKNDIKQSLGTKSGPCDDKSDRKAKGSTHHGQRRSESEYNRSKPGESPHLQCGELRRSIAHEVDRENVVGRVGTNKKYATYLEKGTGRMAARPFLNPALLRCRNTIKRLLTQPIKS